MGDVIPRGIGGITYWSKLIFSELAGARARVPCRCDTEECEEPVTAVFVRGNLASQRPICIR